VESLRQYENGTDNVYGELLPRFISDIFKQTRLKSNQVFVDLGSGVGNVVLQAALEIGCESWGCEVMQNACELADLQHSEFKSRCRLWGLTPGEVHLFRGDFLNEESIAKALRKADVVLINNQAFTPQLNDKLVNHFLDLKEGCQIVSLKSFVPTGHKIQSRNLNSPLNLLSVEKKNYWSECVSWTNAGGQYFIATKDSSRLKAFLDGKL
jgi:H3 lysine-79-specific histone-lysine N-methyltransferase